VEFSHGLGPNRPIGDVRFRRSGGKADDYRRENIHYSFSGFNFPATFVGLLLEVGVETVKLGHLHRQSPVEPRQHEGDPFAKTCTLERAASSAISR
jgi:hypothetical protein